MKKHWYHYLWIYSLCFFIAGFFNILFAWLGLISFILPLIFAIGNAPTALVRLYELITEGKLKPELIIGVPVGFVNVVQSKELIMETDAPYIVAKGRKGGSNIAACIVNALLYMIDDKRD